MSSRATVVERAIAAGLDYVLSLQAEDGSWTEWALPPGSSAAWTTAYVGYRLRCLPPALGARAAPRIGAAARWQRDHAFADGGWGYNTAVESDADSTAHAILFLASAGGRAPDAAYATLAGFQRADGGYATYRPAGPPSSWNVSHPDVTPVALLALLTHPAPDRAAIERGIAYVLRQVTPRGLWHSFWWGTPLYGTEASLALLRAAGAAMPSPEGLAQIRPGSAFEAALLLSCLLHADPDGSRAAVGGLVERLLGGQRPDGSWPSAPALRITRRDCHEPWACEDAGPLYAEVSGLFTAAAALHALSRALPRVT